MINRFDKIKEQLKELSGIINSFNSEAVQIRIVDHLFDAIAEHRMSDIEDAESSFVQIQEPRKERAKEVRPAIVSNKAKDSKKRVSSGDGPVATLGKIFAEGFFSENRTIKDIIQHCDVNLARKIKAGDISGKLARMVRNGELARRKNDDNQYEYINPQ